MLSGRSMSHCVWAWTHSIGPGGAPVLASPWWTRARSWTSSLCTEQAGTKSSTAPTRNLRRGKRWRSSYRTVKLTQSSRERKSMKKVRGFLTRNIKVTKVDRSHKTLWCMAGWTTPRVVLKWTSLHIHLCPTPQKNLSEILHFLCRLPLPPPLLPQSWLVQNHLHSTKTRDQK